MGEQDDKEQASYNRRSKPTWTYVKRRELTYRNSRKVSEVYINNFTGNQKTRIEVNNDFIRRVVLKGSSFDDLSQPDIDSMMCHINSESSNQSKQLVSFGFVKISVRRRHSWFVSGKTDRTKWNCFKSGSDEEIGCLFIIDSAVLPVQKKTRKLRLHRLIPEKQNLYIFGSTNPILWKFLSFWFGFPREILENNLFFW